MDALCQGSQDKMNIFLLGVQVLNQRTIEGQQDELMSPNDSRDQPHVHQFVRVFLIFAIHDVEELLYKHLSIVEEVDRHEVSIA